MRHRVFVASALESKAVAEAVQNNLSADDFARATVWDQVFRPGQFTLEALIEQARSVDFGVFIFTGDDLARIREQDHTVTRDNVVFELGLFTGYLGRHRCVLLLPNQSGGTYHLTGDLAGITTVRYSVPVKGVSLEDATRRACRTIKDHISTQTCLLPATAKDAIRNLLQSTAKLIGGDEVRGFCHLFDGTHLVPVVYFLGSRFDLDPHVEIPANQPWYIVARSFSTDGYVCGDVDHDVNKSDIPGARKVRDDIKSVAAAPIPSADNDPMGTVAFDSNKGLAETRWHENIFVREAIQLLGEAISTIVRRIR